MTQKPSGEFFDTLGPFYVYAYVDSDEWLYVGKGTGDRCWAHVMEKGYDPEHIQIVAKNLTKKQALVLEAHLIETKNPRDNKVSGHHKEKIVMQPLSTIFGEFKNSQVDLFNPDSPPDWYKANYDGVFKNCVREVKINSTTFWVLSSPRNKTYMSFYWTPETQEPIKVTFEVNAKDNQELVKMQGQLKSWLSPDYTEFFSDGSERKMAIQVKDIESVVELFKNFWS